MRKNLYAIVLGVCAVLALSACDTLDLTPEKKSNDAAPQVEAAGNPAVETPEPSKTAGALVKAVQATIGTIVTTGAGLPLYRWDKDSADTSTCYDDCATRFTAYPYSEDLAFEGVERKYVGKVRRRDGTWQLTLNRQPVYTHLNDESGTYRGQGHNGTWWLTTPTGGRLTTRT